MKRRDFLMGSAAAVVAPLAVLVPAMATPLPVGRLGVINDVRFDRIIKAGRQNGKPYYARIMHQRLTAADLR